MTASLIQFLVSAAIIVAAGAALTQFGDIISHRTKLGGLLVGSILIAGATSLPELAVDFNAVRLGAIDLAVGDLMGSSLINLLILAVLDLSRHSHGQMLSRRSAGHVLTASASVMLAALAGLFILLGPRLEGVTLARVGPGSLALVAAYVVCIRIVYLGRGGPGENPAPTEGKPAIPLLGGLGLKGAITGYLVTGVLILIAAPFLARAADDLAERTGLGGTFFGTTFVALCTSLPEVVTTFSAVRLKAFDMAVGNVFGSNCFNMVIFFPLDLAHEGSLLAAVSQSHVYTALAVIVVTTVVILGQLNRAPGTKNARRRHILEPDARLVLMLIFAALTGLYFVR